MAYNYNVPYNPYPWNPSHQFVPGGFNSTNAATPPALPPSLIPPTVNPAVSPTNFHITQSTVTQPTAAHSVPGFGAGIFPFGMSGNFPQPPGTQYDLNWNYGYNSNSNLNCSMYLLWLNINPYLSKEIYHSLVTHK